MAKLTKTKSFGNLKKYETCNNEKSHRNMPSAKAIFFSKKYFGKEENTICIGLARVYEIKCLVFYNLAVI